MRDYKEYLDPPEDIAVETETKSYTWYGIQFEYDDDDYGWVRVKADLDVEIEQTFEEDTGEEYEGDRVVDSLKIKNVEITDIVKWWATEKKSLIEYSKRIEEYINSQRITDIIEICEIERAELFE